MSDYAFQLRIRLYRSVGPTQSPVCTITAYDDLVPQWDSAGRVRLTVEVRHDGVVVFPKGQLTCALHGASDGIAAKELVMQLVGMHPSNGSGVDDDYYEGYTPEQIAWVEAHGEALDMERSARYCDPETGEVRASQVGPSHRVTPA